MRRLSDGSAMSEARRFKTLTLSRAVGSGAGGVALPQATAQNQMIIASAAPAWTLLAAPTAEGQIPITGADPYTPAWGKTFPTVMQFDAGITFGGATGVNVVTVPDDAAQAMHIVDAGDLEYLRVISSNAQPVMVFNEGGVDVDLRIEAVGQANALFVQGSNGYIGAGTPTPADIVHLYSTANAARRLIVDAQGNSGNQSAALELITLGDGSKTLGDAATLGWHLTAHGNAYTIAAYQNDMELVYWDGSGFNTRQYWDRAGNAGLKTDNPAADFHVVGDTVANKHYSAYRTQILEKANVALQLIGADASTGMAHVILTAAPASGDNKHWIISHLGPDESNRFSIGYKTSSADDFTVYDPTEHFVILTNGKTGLGLIPSFKLDVKDTADASFVAMFFNDGNNVNRHVLKLRGGADNGAAVGTTIYVRAADGDDDVTGDIKTVDGVFQLVDVSDEGRKVKIEDTKLNGLDIINALRVRDYNWKGNPDGPVMTNFVAQEAQEVYPAMVSEMDEEGTLGTSRAMLIPILTKAIQELDARLTRGGL